MRAITIRCRPQASGLGPQTSGPQTSGLGPQRVRSRASGRKRTIAAFLALTVIAMATPAAAQIKLPPQRRSIGIRAYGSFEFERKTASKSFEAVLGRPGIVGFGGGVEILRVAKDLFVRFGLTLSKASGSRVAIAGDEVIEFDPPIDLDVTSMPVELAAGWRFTPRPRKGVRVVQPSRTVPYVGGGLLLTRYREVSEFDEPGTGEFETFRGYLVFGGVEFGLGGALMLSGEAQYRIVPNALGDGGVSAHFEETDLGGLALRVLVGFRK